MITVRTMSLSLLAVAALGLSACGGNDNEDALKDVQKSSEALQKTAEQAKQQLDQAREQAEKALHDATEQADDAAADEAEAATEDTDATAEDAQDAATAAEAATSKTAQSLRETMHKRLREIEQKVKSGQISEAEGQQEAGKLTREVTQKLMESMEAGSGK